MTGRICWLNGPIAGNPNDIQIFHDCLRQRVEENEKILTSNIHTPSAFFFLTQEIRIGMNSVPLQDVMLFKTN